MLLCLLTQTQSFIKVLSVDLVPLLTIQPCGASWGDATSDASRFA
jgi:hypothetical protein